MFHKKMIVLCAVLVLSLLGGGLASAGDGLPTWETAFDPGSYIGDSYLVNSVEVYKEQLYIVAGMPWPYIWGVDYSPGQVFRSPDGENWEAASEPGFGLGYVDDNCGQNYYDTSWDMAVFQDKIYVLPHETCYLRPGAILRSTDGENWESVATTEQLGFYWDYADVTEYAQFYKFGVFNGMLYVSLNYYDPEIEFVSSIILRSKTGDPGTWEAVATFPWNQPGPFHVFKGALYVASNFVVDSSWAPAPEQIARTFDGVNWEIVVDDGFGNPGTDDFGGFADYQGYLYLGVGTYEGGGGQIWRSQDGLLWEQVPLNGFVVSPPDDKVDGLVVYHGWLYAYTVNWIEGGSVYRTKDAVNWEVVSEPGWGDPYNVTTHLSEDQAVFKDDLYMGVVGPQGVLLKLAHPDK